jgi:hypothetical protein
VRSVFAPGGMAPKRPSEQPLGLHPDLLPPPAALFLDPAQRAGMGGIQEGLSFFFKSPMTLPELYPAHDLFIQLMKLKHTLRAIRGEDLITHLGLDYYE